MERKPLNPLLKNPENFTIFSKRGEAERYLQSLLKESKLSQQDPNSKKKHIFSIEEQLTVLNMAINSK